MLVLTTYGPALSWSPFFQAGGWNSRLVSMLFWVSWILMFWMYCPALTGCHTVFPEYLHLESLNFHLRILPLNTLLAQSKTWELASLWERRSLTLDPVREVYVSFFKKNDFIKLWHIYSLKFKYNSLLLIRLNPTIHSQFLTPQGKWFSLSDVSSSMFQVVCLCLYFIIFSFLYYKWPVGVGC